MEKPWHAMDTDTVLKTLAVNPERGISTEEAKRRTKIYGYNELPIRKRRGLLRIILKQFKDIFVLMLIFASAIAFFVEKSYVDSLVILIIIGVNTVISVYQEYKAENVMEKLREYASPKARVLREGEVKEIMAREIVPGDIIILEEGDLVPADARVIESHNLEVNEAPLTGESIPVSKYDMPMPKQTPVPDRKNILYMGTFIVRGRGKAVVINTGLKTEFGRVAKMVEEAAEEETPLRRKLSDFAMKMAMSVVVLMIVIFTAGYIRFGSTKAFESFMVAISLAVAAVPEGLPAILTITLAIAAKRLARKKALVKYLLAAETLGSVTVICTDKTGTITEGVMTTRNIYAGGREYEVTGTGYNFEGKFILGSEEIDPMRDPLLSKILTVGLLCTNVSMGVELIGDPTELAIAVAAAKAGFHKAGLEKLYPRLYEVPFSSQRKMMSTINNFGENGYYVCTKGAPEIILDRCRFIEIEYEKYVEINDEIKREILSKLDSYAKKGYRVLAIAYKTIKPSEFKPDEDGFNDKVERDLVFLGLIAMMDPPRPEVYDAIKKTKEAGINVIMVTGDHAITAKSVAEEIGLYREGDEIIVGTELQDISEDDLAERIEKVRIFARVMPEHKSKIVNALKKKGEVVAMTGDGVNDAPALKIAHIGVAMGKRGTDVAREAADMILLDDNFATIVKAVDYGRGVYGRIRSFTRFLISCNLAEVLIITIGMLLFFDVPLLPAMILWINLVTDGPPATALAWDPPFDEMLKRKPRRPEEGLLSGMLLFVAVTALVLTTGCIITYYYYYNVLRENMMKIRTVLFLQVSLFELFIVWNCRSETKSVFKIGFRGNKWLVISVILCAFLTVSLVYTPLRTAFHLVKLNAIDWLFIFAVASLGFFILPEFLMKHE